VRLPRSRFVGSDTKYRRQARALMYPQACSTATPDKQKWAMAGASRAWIGAPISPFNLFRTKRAIPATFLAKKKPPQGIEYKRVTPRFFAVSSVRKDKIWYDRCNFSGHYINCVLINYPAAEERQWDDIVTRISLSLSAR
jgi:hypothetical protein